MANKKIEVREGRKFKRTLTIAAGCIITIGLGLACLWSAAPLERASYDLPFRWRPPLDPMANRIVLVYVDAQSAQALRQPLDDVWDRALYIPLLHRLTTEGARLVFCDVVFDAPRGDATDAAFADAISQNGNVILGAISGVGGVPEGSVFAPIKVLRKAARAWGLLSVDVDADYVVRRLFAGKEIPTATWRAADVLGAPVTKTPPGRAATRWVNYYGPPGHFPSLNFAQALDTNAVPEGFFKDKLVMVGGWDAPGPGRDGRDEFLTPYSGGVRQLSQGLEVHATILLNYLQSEWLTRMVTAWQVLIVVIIGVFAGLLSRLRPLAATTSAVVLAALIAVAACWLVWNRHTWFNWLTPAAVQMPIGLFWAVGSQYLLESKRRKELLRAFGLYHSPEIAERIADADFDLKPGGKVIEVTVIFTDLENFTTLSEKLDPTEVSAILTTYFGQTARCIRQYRGAIIQYMGDAVFAAWDAFHEPEHAILATEAGCDLRALTELEVRGKKLRTRVGIHTGRVLAGNLGSEFRFDYTMIGDAVNFASRLESLNKYLGTQVLLSDEVQRQLEDRFMTRRLGEFRVVGRTESVGIHELLCRRDVENANCQWIEIFEQGVAAFRARDFERARDLMISAREMREGTDGPAEFYLGKIAKLEAGDPVENWTGVINLSEK